MREAIVELEKEIQYIAETGMGRLYVISGATGSGKTTFLNSLGLFIDGVGVHSVKTMQIDRRESIEDALAALRRENDKVSIVVLEGKEAPGALRTEQIDVLLTALNADFRGESGRRTLFVIPTTSQSVAQAISARATSIGGMTLPEKPFYVFTGPLKNEYVSITDDTIRALNESRTLAEYGISSELARGLAEAAETIGSFIAACHSEIRRRRDALAGAANAIKRKRVHLWMVFCSLEENPRRNSDIIRALTSGDSQHVQVRRILAGDSKEVRYWQDKEGAFSLAAQYLDLRITYLPQRTAVAVASAYGHKEFIRGLKASGALEREATRERAQDSMRNTAIGAFLSRSGFSERDPSKRGRLHKKHLAQFKEIVKLTTRDDKAANSMIAAALRDLNEEPETRVVVELALNEQATLVSDIAVVTPTDIYCLEVKWRSSLLSEGDVIRETVGRVKEFASELPELKNLLSGPA